MKKPFKDLLSQEESLFERLLINTAVVVGVASCVFGAGAIFYHILIKII